MHGRAGVGSGPFSCPSLLLSASALQGDVARVAQKITIAFPGVELKVCQQVLQFIAQGRVLDLQQLVCGHSEHPALTSKTMVSASGLSSLHCRPSALRPRKFCLNISSLMYHSSSRLPSMTTSCKPMAFLRILNRMEGGSCSVLTW